MPDLRPELLGHLRRLSAEIGPRPAGSPANQAAAEYIESIFAAAGLEIERQPYPCAFWQERKTSLSLGGQDLPAAANAFSPPCDVSAATVAAATLAELDAADLSGKLAVLYGDLMREPLAAKSWFLKGERDERIVRNLEEKRPAAVLTVQSGPYPLPRLIEDRELLVPSATVPAEAGLALLRALGQPAHVRIASENTPSETWNVVGRRPGSGPERIVLCAHYDSKVDTPAAWDNASGVAVLLALAGRLGRRGGPFGLECVAFTSEEYLPLGDDEYVRRCGERFGQMVAALNFDGIGQILGSPSITAIGCSPAFEEQVHAAAAAYPGLVWVEPWPQSNHSTFAWRGVPSLAFTTSGGVALGHSRADTVDWLDVDKVADVVAVAEAIVDGLQDKGLAWTRP